MASVVKSLKLKESTSDSLELSWKRQIQREIDGYRIFYHEMRRQKVYYGTFLDSNATGYNIRSLSADTEYKICLAAYEHGNRNKIKDKHCIQATTSSWHIPVSVGSSIGALVALLIILGIVLYARCQNRKHKNRKQGSSDVNQNQFHSMFSSETDASNYAALSEFSDVALHINNGCDVTNDALTEVSSNAERKEAGLLEEDNGIGPEDLSCSVCFEIQQCPYCEVVDESSVPPEALAQLEEKREVRKSRTEDCRGSGLNAAPAVNQNNGHLYMLVSEGGVHNNVTNRDATGGVQTEAGDERVTGAGTDVTESRDEPTELPKKMVGNKRSQCCERHEHRCDARAPLIRHNSSPCCVQNSAIVPISGFLDSDED